MTPELLAGFVAIVLSFLLEWVPGFSTWFQPLDESKKKLISLGLFVAVGVAVFALSCAGLAEQVGIPAVVCDVSGGIVLAKAIFGALVGGVSIHRLIKRNE